MVEKQVGAFGPWSKRREVAFDHGPNAPTCILTMVESNGGSFNPVLKIKKKTEPPMWRPLRREERRQDGLEGGTNSLYWVVVGAPVCWSKEDGGRERENEAWWCPTQWLVVGGVPDWQLVMLPSLVAGRWWPSLVANGG